MAKSLQDQLLGAGLVSKEKAKEVSKEKRKKKNKQPKGSVQVDEAKVRAQQAQQEKAERDRELNRQQKEKSEQKAIKAQIKQLIEMNRIDRADGEVSFQFADGKKIKKIYVTEKLQNQLGKGLISIAKLEEGYELVPKGVAEKVAQRDESLIITISVDNDTPDEDDPYADYQIPDDLMW